MSKKNNPTDKSPVIEDEFKCSECSDEAYFYEFDGTGYCQVHAMKHLQEIMHQKNIEWICPYCSEVSNQDDKLLHLSLNHMKEIEDERRRHK